MTNNTNATMKKEFVPTNSATILFCFFEGSLLSLPVGGLEKNFISFTAPAWTAPIYWALFLYALFGMPIWCLVFRRKYRRLGTMAIVTVLTVFFVGILVPGLPFTR